MADYPMIVDQLCGQNHDPSLRRLVNEAFSAGRGSLASTVASQAAEIERLTKEGCAMGHVIVEAGINPGIDYSCRCEECRFVAVKLDEAGFVDDVKDRWWDGEKDDRPRCDDCGSLGELVAIKCGGYVCKDCWMGENYAKGDR